MTAGQTLETVSAPLVKPITAIKPCPAPSPNHPLLAPLGVSIRFQSDCAKLLEFVQRTQAVLESTQAAADMRDQGWQEAFKVHTTMNAP